MNSIRILSRAPALITLTAISTLGGALAFQYLGDLAPCPLCMVQRAPWTVLLMLGIGTWAFVDDPVARRGALWLAAVIAVIGGGIAAYHAGVEYKIFAGPGACSGVPISAGTLDELRAAIMAAPVVRCDEIPWSLFGVSLAGFNALISFGLGIYCILAATTQDSTP